MTAARLAVRRVEAAGAALAALGLPAVMLDGRGRALTANGLAETLVGTLRWKVRDRVAFADRAADRLLREAIGLLDMRGHLGVRTFPVRNDETGSTLIASFRAGAPVRAGRLLALRRRAHPHAGRGRARGAVELLHPVRTTAESRLARGMAERPRVARRIAGRAGISRNTAQSLSLRRSFERLVSPQAELTTSSAACVPSADRARLLLNRDPQLPSPARKWADAELAAAVPRKNPSRNPFG